MELVLDFLDGSFPKTFIIPITSTAHDALRVIFYKFDLYADLEDLSEYYLALTSSPFPWVNIKWLETTTNLHTLANNGQIHVFLLKKYFLLNNDIHIARTNPFLCSLLYSQFYLLYVSHVCDFPYLMVVSLSARLLQCEFSEREISIESILSKGVLSVILPPKYHGDPSIDKLIFSCWRTLENVPENIAKFSFITDILSEAEFKFRYLYDIYFCGHCLLTVSDSQIAISFPKSTMDSYSMSKSSLSSFSCSSEFHSISCNFPDLQVTFYSEYFSEILSILSDLSDASRVSLDDMHTDVANTDFQMETLLDTYLSYFHLDDVGFCFDSSNATQDCTSEGINHCSDYSFSDLDKDYDILLNPAIPSQDHIARTLIRGSDSLYSPKHPIHLNDHPMTPLFEYQNPIYDYIYSASSNTEEVYLPSTEFYHEHFISKGSSLPSILASNIQNLSNFEMMGATYNDIQELQIDTQLSNGCRMQVSLDASGIVNQCMHAETLAKPIVIHSFSPIRYFMTFTESISNFPEFLNFHYVFYILLPNRELLHELVDIRTKPKDLVYHLGELLGISEDSRDYFLTVIGNSFSYSSTTKIDLAGKLVFENPIQPSSDPINSSEPKDRLEPDIEFLNQNIKGSIVLHLQRNLFQGDHNQVIPSCKRDLLYLRCCNSILHGNIPISLQLSVEFAALQYQAYRANIGILPDSNSCSLLEFIPEEYKHIRGISKQIVKEQSTLHSYSLSMVMDALIHKYMNLPQSQYIFFDVKEIKQGHLLQHPKLIHTYIGISKSGLISIHPISKRILSIVHYQSIQSWRYTKGAFIYQNGQDEKVVALKTSQGFCISTIIYAYIDQISNTLNGHRELSGQIHSDVSKVSVIHSENFESFPNENHLYESV